MDVITIIYGILPSSIGNNTLENTLILLYKQLVFTCKERTNDLTLNLYKSKLKQLESVEYTINKTKHKFGTHRKKWAKYAENITDL